MICYAMKTEKETLIINLEKTLNSNENFSLIISEYQKNNSHLEIEITQLNQKIEEMEKKYELLLNEKDDCASILAFQLITSSLEQSLGNLVLLKVQHVHNNFVNQPTVCADQIDQYFAGYRFRYFRLEDIVAIRDQSG